MKSARLPVLLPAAVWTMPGAGVSLAATTLDLTRHNPESAWLQSYDPSLVTRRILTELSCESDDHSDLWKVETSFRWGLPVRKAVCGPPHGFFPILENPDRPKPFRKEYGWKASDFRQGDAP